MLRAQERFERGHGVSELGVIAYLVHQPEPAANIGGGSWSWEVPDGIDIFRQWFDGGGSDMKSRKIDVLLGELELLRVQNYARIADSLQEVHGAPPVGLQVHIVVHRVVHASFLSFEVG